MCTGPSLHNKRKTRPCQLTASMYLLTMRYLSWNGLDPEFVKERTCLIIFKSVICSSTLPHYYMPSNNVYQTVCLSFCLLIAMTPLNLFTPWSCTVAGPLHCRRYDRKEAAELWWQSNFNYYYYCYYYMQFHIHHRTTHDDELFRVDIRSHILVQALPIVRSWCGDT